MSSGAIKQCKSVTKNNCRCKNHVITDGDYCKIHSKNEVASTNSATNIIPNNIHIHIVNSPTNSISLPQIIEDKSISIKNEVVKNEVVDKEVRKLCSCITKKGELCKFPSSKEYNGKLMCVRHFNKAQNKVDETPK